MRAKNCKNVRGKGGSRSNKREKEGGSTKKREKDFFLDEEARGPRETCEKKRELLSEQKKITRSNHTKQRLTDSSFLLL
jgi:hypothetical protein